MPQAPDAAAQLVLALPPRGRRWVIPGGEDGEESTTLHVIVSPDDAAPARRFRLTVPLITDSEGGLTVGEPLVEELP